MAAQDARLQLPSASAYRFVVVLAHLYVGDISCLEDSHKSTKFDTGVESILKKDCTRATRSSSGGDHPKQRRKDGNVDSGGLRKSNGCGGSRRVLFKNNVSVYRFDTEPPLRQIGADPDSCRLPASENGVRSNGIVRPPSLLCSRDGSCRSSVNHKPLNPSHRRTEQSIADNNPLASSSVVIVGDFQV